MWALQIFSFGTSVVRCDRYWWFIAISSFWKNMTVLWCTYQCHVGGGGEGEGSAWAGDLIVFVGLGVGHLTDLVLAGEGMFGSFFAQRGDIWLPTRTKNTETEHYVSCFHASRMCLMVWKIWKSSRPTGTSESWVVFIVCLQISFVLVCFWLIELLKILWYQSKRTWRETKSILASIVDQCMAHLLQSLYKTCKTYFLCTLN